MKFKIITIIILSMTLLFIVTSCEDGNKVTENDNLQTMISDNEENETDIQAEMPNIDSVDAGGRDFVILNRKTSANYNAHPYAEFSAESQTGDILNDAVYYRNLFIAEKYNVNIVSEEADDVKDIASKAFMAGEGSFDVISLPLRNAFSLAVSDYLYDINTIPYLDFDRPWWMSNIMNDTSIGHKNYFMSGDMNIGALNTVGVTYFNKKLIDNHNLENPYSLVNEGTWTIDKLAEMSRIVTEDLNGDGVYNQDDKFGLDCSSFAWQPFYYGTDNLMIKKDSNDIPYFDANNEKMYDSIVKIITLLNDKTATLNVNHLSGVGDLGLLTVNMFKTDRALFFIELIYGVPPLRDMDSDFGLIPMPKHDENQTTYTTYLHTSNASTIVVLKTNDELDLTGRILEDMAYQSYVNIRPTFYDIMLKTKFSRDNESVVMLDIIYENVKIDLALVMIDYGINIDGLLRDACTKNNTDIISILAANEEMYNTSIENAIEILTNK